MSETKKNAKRLYLEGEKPKVIAARLDINYNTLKYWIDKGSKEDPPWKEIREAGKQDQLLNLLKDKKATLQDIYDLGLSIVQRGLAHIEIQELILEPQALGTIIKILDSVDKFKKCDESTKKGNINVVNLKKSQKHPFLDESN